MTPDRRPSPRRFLALFAVYLVIFYVGVAIRPVNDAVVIPAEATLARRKGRR